MSLSRVKSLVNALVVDYAHVKDFSISATAVGRAFAARIEGQKVPSSVVVRVYFEQTPTLTHCAGAHENANRAVMERLRHVCHTEDRKVLVSIDRLDLCKVGGRAYAFIHRK